MAEPESPTEKATPEDTADSAGSAGGNAAARSAAEESSALDRFASRPHLPAPPWPLGLRARMPVDEACRLLAQALAAECKTTGDRAIVAPQRPFVAADGPLKGRAVSRLELRIEGEAVVGVDAFLAGSAERFRFGAEARP